MDLNDTGGLQAPSPPPRGLRAYGRASSFLQMFSQGSAESLEGGESEGKDGMANDDDDNFIISRPTRMDSAGSVGEFNLTVPSPKPPMRGRRRDPFTPPSPANGANDDGNQSSPSSFSRFLSDFEVVALLGDGSFGSVYSVRNRTDRRTYAVKAAKREARSSSDRNRMLQEVYALAALGDRSCEGEMHVVRYHQAWMEGRRLYIQTELCELTLAEEMRIGAAAAGGGGGGVLSGERRYKLLREMLLALDLVHKSGMIHLDIKVRVVGPEGGRVLLDETRIFHDVDCNIRPLLIVHSARAPRSQNSISWHVDYACVAREYIHQERPLQVGRLWTGEQDRESWRRGGGRQPVHVHGVAVGRLG